MMRRMLPLAAALAVLAAAPAAHAGTYSFDLTLQGTKGLAWKAIGSPQGAALWHTALSGGAPSVELDRTQEVPAGSWAGWSLKLPAGLTARKVQLSGPSAINGSPIDARVAIGDAVGAAPLEMNVYGKWDSGVHKVAPTNLVRWRVVVPATTPATTDPGALRVFVDRVRLTLVESGKPTITQFGGVTTDSRTHKPYTHFRLRDALSGVARLTVAGKACWKVAPFDLNDHVLVGQAERTKVVACYIPKGATRVTATVVDVAGNAATKTLTIH